MRASEANVNALYRSNSRRRQSLSETYHTPPARRDDRRRSWLSHTNNHTNHNSSPRSVPPEEQVPPHSARPLRITRMDDPESAGSTTATSTVWDDLDELKSRVRHLEGTGKAPQSSNVTTSNGSGDRPRTATTSGTTISSSPRQNRKPSIMPAETFGSPDCVNVHPLLHSALFKAKGVLSPAIYRALESSSIDALELAAITGSSTNSTAAHFAGTSGAHIMPSSSSFSDRHLRRKTDGLCRGLTELCIALCEARNTLDSPSPAVARSERESLNIRKPGVVGAVLPFTSEPSSAAASLNKRITSLNSSQAPESPSRISPSRALDRVEARRSSLAALGGSHDIAVNRNSSVSSAARRTTIDVNSSSISQNQYSNRNNHSANNRIPSLSIDNVSNNRPTPSRLGRAGTSLLLQRRRTLAGATTDTDSAGALSTDDDELSNEAGQPRQKKLLRHRYDLRAPSRALTDFGRLRSRERDQEKAQEFHNDAEGRDKANLRESNKSKSRTSKISLTSRAYTSQHPLPDQPASSPLTQSFLSSSIGSKTSNNFEGDNVINSISNVVDPTGQTNPSSSSFTSASSRLRVNDTSNRRLLSSKNQDIPSSSTLIRATNNPANHATMRNNITGDAASNVNSSSTSYHNKSPRRSVPFEGSADEWRQKLAMLGSSDTPTRAGASTAKTVVATADTGGSRSAFSRLASRKDASKAASLAG